MIAADGGNAGVAESLAMNKERTYFVTALGLIYSIKGLKDFDPTAWKSYYGLACQSKRPGKCCRVRKGRGKSKKTRCCELKFYPKIL